MTHSPARGTVHEVDLGGSTIRYRETGEGPTVVFVHGLLVNGDLWRKVVPQVAAAGYRCITPDWPLGSHEIPVPKADLSPPGVSDLIAAFLEKLDLTDVTLVANDTGGAITEILMSRNHSRVGRVVLTPSDSYEHFLPPVFKPLVASARIPGAVRFLTESLRIRALHRLPVTFGWVSKRPLPREITDAYLLPSRRSAEIRKDLRRFLIGVNKRHTLAAAQTFPTFTKPVLLAWAREDKLFPLSIAERLAADLPNATLKVIDDSYTFVPEDQPDLLVDLILEFTRLHAAT